MILRNLVWSDYRKHRHEVEDIDGKYVDCLKSPPEQHSRLDSRKSAWRYQAGSPANAGHCLSLARQASLRAGGCDLRDDLGRLLLATRARQLGTALQGIKTRG
jgi:hypothetical protein